MEGEREREGPAGLPFPHESQRSHVWAVGWVGLLERGTAKQEGAPGSGSSRRRSSDGGCDDNVVVYCSDSGHAGAVSWQERNEEFSRQVSFLHNALGLEKI